MPSFVPPEGLGTAFRLICLADTFSYARSHCPYYRSYPPEEIRRFSDVDSLPVLERNIVVHRLPELCAEGVKLLYYTATSGTSTGTSLYVPRSRTEQRVLQKYRSRLAAVSISHPQDREAEIMLRLLPGGRMIPGGAGRSNEMLFVFFNNMARENLWDNWDTLLSQLFAEFPTPVGNGRITTIHATPPYGLLLLTRIMRQRGLNPADTAVRHLVITGGHMGSYRRRWLCEQWNAEVATAYSCAELNHSARECRLFPKRYHFDVVSHVEVVDPDSGFGVATGEEGRVLLTGLFPFHQAAILLRYAVGDWAKWLGGGRCECGVVAPTIELLGRERHCKTVELADGRRLVLSSAPTLEALERFDYVAQIPRPQFAWEVIPGQRIRLRLHVECHALGNSCWQRRSEEEIVEAIVCEAAGLASAIQDGLVDVEVVLRPRSALTVNLSAV